MTQPTPLSDNIFVSIAFVLVVLAAAYGVYRLIKWRRSVYAERRASREAELKGRREFVGRPPKD